MEPLRRGLSAQEPDYRFTLANERTFLSWIRRTRAGMHRLGVLELEWTYGHCAYTRRQLGRLHGSGSLTRQPGHPRRRGQAPAQGQHRVGVAYRRRPRRPPAPLPAAARVRVGWPRRPG
ncbi:DUF202 domain-containing protein [Lentzea kentuckyensis]|uniref:DUF202 domain-containing protein n=1 Tax=Lentzea kentuckyensis TaxID=360086 RepID=UPI0031837139